MKFEGVTASPLCWPIGRARTKRPVCSRFGSLVATPSVYKATQEVLAELGRMGVPASRAIISTNYRLRLDGLPYSSQREPDDSGVAVYFKVDGEPIVLSCDRWRTCGENLWAVAKHISALRGQERWGVGSVAQAFAGFKMLGDGHRSWREVFAFYDGEPVTPTKLKAQWKKLAMVRHPDKGGSEEDMSRLNAAYTEAMKELQ